MLKYYILLIINAILIKTYDDLNDNNLFEYFHLLDYKDYINEFLKCTFGISFTILCITFPIQYLGFFILNIICLLYNSIDYKIYERMGLLSSIILIPFLNFNVQDVKITDIKQIDIFNSFIISILVLCECIISPIEYNYTKLILRFSESIIIFLLLLNYIIFFNKNTFFDNNIILVMISLICYALTSSFFQYFLIKRGSMLKDIEIKKETERIIIKDELKEKKAKI